MMYGLVVPLLLACVVGHPVLAQQGKAAKPAAPGRPVVEDSQKAQPFPFASLKLPVFPPLGTPKQLEEGVFFAEVEAAWPRGKSKVWIYLPALDVKPKSLPCVLIAPAGSNMLFGMDLGDGDRNEHLPYVKAGFAVVAYEVEGVMPADDQQTDANVLRQLRRYLDCDAGMQDARYAIEYALANVPAVDPKKMFAAGHSSAATTALLFAAHEPRLRGCAAFAPIIDVLQRIPAPNLEGLEKDFPSYRNFLVRSSPNTHQKRLGMPLFVFSAEDDDNAKFADTKAFVEQLRAAKKEVEFDTVPEGGHYQPMVDTGIAHAIAWMQKVCAAVPAPAKGKG
jgi:dipeptidyl aminopeptidase/acylaminoacyl peptidase